MFVSPLQCSDPECVSPSAAMTKRVAAAAGETVKEFVVTPVEEVDMEKFSVKQRGRDGEAPCFYASYDHRQLVLNLTTKKWFRVAFPIDSAGEKLDDKTQSLNVAVVVDRDVASTIQTVEATIKERLLSVCPKAQWKDSIRSMDHFDPIFRMKLVVKAANEAHLSVCTVREFGKAPVRGIVSEAALTPLLRANRGFVDANVKLGVALFKVWTMKDKQTGEIIGGATWRITNMMADLAENVKMAYPDIFAEEDFPEQ